MTITVLARYQKSVLVSPDPAVVQLGEQVSWLLRFENRQEFPRSVSWKIYFQHQHPFGTAPDCSWTVVVEASEGLHSGGETRERGNFKYGIRLVDTETQATLSDDDPILTVI